MSTTANLFPGRTVACSIPGTAHWLCAGCTECDCHKDPPRGFDELMRDTGEGRMFWPCPNPDCDVPLRIEHRADPPSLMTMKEGRAFVAHMGRRPL